MDRASWFLTAAALPGVVAVAGLLIGGALGRRSVERWAGPAAVAALVFAAMVLGALTLTSDEAGRAVAPTTMSWGGAPPPGTLAAETRALLRARDADQDGALAGAELAGVGGDGRLGLDRSVDGRSTGDGQLGLDRSGDGRLSADELALGLARSGSGWLGSAGAGRGAQPGFAPRLTLDRAALAIACVLALVCAAVAGHLLPGGPRGDELANPRPLLWIAAAAGPLIASVALAPGLLSVGLWSLGLAAAVGLHHDAALDGAPNRLGVGTLLLLGAGVALALVGAHGAPDPDALAASAPWWSGACLTVGLLVPSLVLPLLPGAEATRAPAAALAFGGVATAALALLQRVSLAGVGENGGGPELVGAALGGVGPALALVAASAALLSSARALLAARLDGGLLWLGAAGVAGIAAVIPGAVSGPAATSAWPTLLAFACAQAALLLGAETAHRRAGGWDLSAVAGALAGRAPREVGARVGVGVALVALVGASAGGFPTRAGAVAAGLEGPTLSGALTAALLLGASALVAAAALRLAWILARAARASGREVGLPSGRGVGSAVGVERPVGEVPSAGALASRRHPAPLLVLAAVGALGAAPLAGLGRGSFAAAWLEGDLSASLTRASWLLLVALAAGLALGVRRARPSSARLRARLASWGARLQPYAPQRRLVQPLLGLGASAASWEERVATRADQVSAAVARRALTPPAFDASREPPPAPGAADAPAPRQAGRRVVTATLIEAALAAALFGALAALAHLGQ